MIANCRIVLLGFAYAQFNVGCILCYRHMGRLKSMRYGSLLKAIYKFTMVRQNYGKPSFHLILFLLFVAHILLKRYKRIRDLDKRNESLSCLLILQLWKLVVILIVSLICKILGFLSWLWFKIMG